MWIDGLPLMVLLLASLFVVFCFVFLMLFSEPLSFFFFYEFSFILLYVVLPGPPENLRVISKTSRVVNISWTPGFNGNSDILNYTVEVSTDNQTFAEATCPGLSSSGCVVSSSFPSASLVNLHPGRPYYIRVFATNKVGVSAVSSVITTTTVEEGKKLLSNIRQLLLRYRQNKLVTCNLTMSM